MKHDDESLAGKSLKNLAKFESYARMEKTLKNRAVSSITAALLSIFSLLKWGSEEIMKQFCLFRPAGHGLRPK